MKPVLFLSIALLIAAPAFAWGPQGHRITGSLAEPYLAPDSRMAIKQLLGNVELATASNWADEMRANPSRFWQEQAGPYHYVTVPPGKTYSDIGAPAKGDAVSALKEFRTVLLDPSASRSHKQLALRFSMHIVQDLHQPLHVGNGKDRGGTRVRVKVDGKSRTLHWLWDTGLMVSTGRSDTQWKKRLRSTLPTTLEGVSADPLIWVAESARYRDQLYPQSKSINETYKERQLPHVEKRLQLAALRTAAYLNAIFNGQNSAETSASL